MERGGRGRARVVRKSYDALKLDEVTSTAGKERHIVSDRETLALPLVAAHRLAHSSLGVRHRRSNPLRLVEYSSGRIFPRRSGKLLEP